jgi:hypothetical protein
VTRGQETIDLIEKTRPPGIIAILDEETRFPKATDITFLEKCHTNFAKNEHYEKPKLSKCALLLPSPPPPPLLYALVPARVYDATGRRSS